jgi:hypothetical protein
LQDGSRLLYREGGLRAINLLKSAFFRQLVTARAQ